MTKGNKKGHAGLIIFILILVLVIGGGTGFYFYQRQQPRKAVENFLDSMKKMDFNTMESMIQSSTGQCRYPRCRIHGFLLRNQQKDDL